MLLWLMVGAVLHPHKPTLCEHILTLYISVTGGGAPMPFSVPPNQHHMTGASTSAAPQPGLNTPMPFQQGKHVTSVAC